MVDEGDRGQRGDVGELRLRLYRRDPPADAVEDYLAALAHAPVVVQTRTSAPVRRERRRTRPVPMRKLVGAAAVVAASVSFAALLPVGIRQLTTLTAVTGTRPAAPARVPPPPATGTALGTMAGGPPSTARFAAEKHVVTVSVLCAGRGTITVRIGGDRPTILTCDTAAPAFAMLQSAGALDRFTLEVVPDRTVRWSLAVGALRPPPPAPDATRRPTSAA